MQLHCINRSGADMAAETKRKMTVAQGVGCFIGISFGLLPLIGSLLGKGSLLLQLFFPEASQVWDYVVPIGVIVLSTLAVMGLEEYKHRIESRV